MSVNAKIILGSKGINRALYVKGDTQTIILLLETSRDMQDKMWRLLLRICRGKIQKQYIFRLSLNSKQGCFLLPAYFARNKDGVFFIPVFENKIYHLTPDTIKAVFDFDFKEFMYPFDEISEKSMLEQEKKYSYFSLFYMTDDGIFVCFNHRGRYPVDICGDIHTALGDNRALLFVERKQLPGFAREHGEEMKSLHGEK